MESIISDKQIVEELLMESLYDWPEPCGIYDDTDNDWERPATECSFEAIWHE